VTKPENTLTSRASSRANSVRAHCLTSAHSLWRIILVLLSCSAARAAPFATRDQNPLLAGFGIPSPLPADSASLPSWDARFNWANSAVVQDDSTEHLTIDAETKELRLVLAHRWNERWATRLQMPYRELSGGSLDSFIDDWHDWFGLPKGIRPQEPHDRLLIDYSHGTHRLHVANRSSGLEDTTLDLGYQVHSSAQTDLMLWTSLKLPTGDSDELTGSGALDESVALALERRFGSRWTLSAQVAGTHLGKGDLLPGEQRSFVANGFAAFTFALTPATELTVQVDAHTAAYKSELDFLSDAQILTIGGAHRFHSGWRLELGVSEDIAVDASPDVVFVVRVIQDRFRH
jgi:hypothetical protein